MAEMYLDGRKIYYEIHGNTGEPIIFLNGIMMSTASWKPFIETFSRNNILILVDDVCQDTGRMRVRQSGSHGGQNGLKNIITRLGSDKFPRIRFGVGQKPNPQYDLAAWVLGVLGGEDKKRLESCFPLIEEAAKMIFDGKMEGAMGLCNGHRPADGV